MISMPLYGFFTHPDGSWYRLWVTHTDPKTERGKPWHLHAHYDKSGTLAPVPGSKWYEQPYGMSNWDFDDDESTWGAFKDRADERFEHGYMLAEGSAAVWNTYFPQQAAEGHPS